MREIDLANGETIEDVTRVTEPDKLGLVNVHQAGGSYRVVDPDDTVADREVA